MTHPFFSRPLITLLLAVGLAPAASAALINQTFTMPSSGTPWSVPDIAFNSFNPALGTLNSVTLAFGGSWSQTIQVSVPAGVGLQTIVSLTSLADVAIYGAANFTNQLVDISGTQAIVEFPGISIGTSTSLKLSTSGSFSYGPATLLPVSDFIGVGTEHFSLAGIGGFTVSGAAQANFQVNTTSGGTLTLVYDYSPTTVVPQPVPEPGMLVLVGLALAGLSASRSRFRPGRPRPAC